MRKSGRWQSIWDDRILEYMNESPKFRLQPVEIYRSDYIHCSKPQIVRRLQTMEEHGLVESEDRGKYRVTEAGEQYLAGKLDVSEESQ